MTYLSLDLVMEEKSTNELKLGPAPAIVYQINGEPAVAINGVPDISADCSSSSQLGAFVDSEMQDPCLGELMEGREVRKIFGKKYYSGKVSKFDQEMNWYRVVYEDGDFEDLYWHELEEVLVPLDISIPLKKLALRTFKHYKSSGEPGESSNKSHKGRQQNVDSTPKVLKYTDERGCTNSKSDKQQDVIFLIILSWGTIWAVNEDTWEAKNRALSKLSFSNKYLLLETFACH